MKWLITALLAALALCSGAAAQPFPGTLPPNSVIGRLGTSAGPSQAIPFPTLKQVLAQEAAGTNLVAGPPTSTVGHLVLWDDTTGTLLKDSGGIAPPVALTGNVTYFVRPDGNNGCDGSTNTTGTSGACAWQTLQYATSYVCNNLILAGFRVTLKLGIPGTYDGHSLCNFTGTYVSGVSSPVIVGDVASQSGYVISSSSTNAVLAVNVGTPWTYQGVTFTTTGGANSCVESDINGLIYLDQVRVGPCGNTSLAMGYHGQIEVIAYNSSGSGTKLTITGGSNIFIVGNYNSGFLIQPGNTVACTGSPAFIDFIQLSFGMLANFDSTTFSGCGSVTGVKWVIDQTSAASLNGQTAASLNNLPGNSNGSFTPQAVERGGTGQISIAAAQAAFGYPVILGGSASAVNLNSATTDTAITITSPTTNYKVDKVTVFNTGTTASLTTATAGLFTATSGGGLALAANQALSGITATGVNTDTNSLDLAITVGARTTISSASLQFRVGSAQGAAATGNVYVWIRPQP